MVKKFGAKQHCLMAKNAPHQKGHISIQIISTVQGNILTFTDVEREVREDLKKHQPL